MYSKIENLCCSQSVKNNLISEDGHVRNELHMQIPTDLWAPLIINSQYLPVTLMNIHEHTDLTYINQCLHHILIRSQSSACRFLGTDIQLSLVLV